MFSCCSPWLLGAASQSRLDQERRKKTRGKEKRRALFDPALDGPSGSTHTRVCVYCLRVGCKFFLSGVHHFSFRQLYSGKLNSPLSGEAELALDGLIASREARAWRKSKQVQGDGLVSTVSVMTPPEWVTSLTMACHELVHILWETGAPHGGVSAGSLRRGQAGCVGLHLKGRFVCWLCSNPQRFNLRPDELFTLS